MIDDGTCYRCPLMKYHEGPCEITEPPMNSDHAPTAEEREDNECIRCNATMSLPYGLEPTEVCNVCAQDERIELVAQLSAKSTHAANLESELAIARALIATMRARIEDLEAEAERYLTQAMNAEGNAVYQTRRAEAIEGSIRAILEGK